MPSASPIYKMTEEKKMALRHVPTHGILSLFRTYSMMRSLINSELEKLYILFTMNDHDQEYDMKR